MSGVIAINPRVQFASTVGAPLINGTLTTYLAGTTTAEPTYQDQALGTPNANPVTLDSRGECVLWLDPTKLYKFLLKNAQGVTQWTQDNIYGPITNTQLNSIYTTFAASGGAALIGLGSSTVAASIREKLLANRTYYVRADGSNANTGLGNTSGTAFLTKQWAANLIQNTLDLNGYTVTVSVNAGTYTGGVSVVGAWIGAGSVIFHGDTGTPGNVTVTTTGDCFSAGNGATFTVSGFHLSSSAANGINASLFSNIVYDSIAFGTCGNMHVNNGTGASVICTGDYSITGGAVGHLHCGAFGLISVPSTTTVTLTGVPAFTAFFIGCAQGTVVWDGPTIVGTATGQKYLAHYGGIIRTSTGIAYTDIPGSTAGRANASGWIVGSNSQPVTFAPDIYTSNTLEITSINFNTQVPVVFFSTANDLFTPKGYFFVNGDDCYSSGRTHIGCAAAVDVTSGTADGATFRAPAAGLTSLSLSNNGLPTLLARRRNSDGALANFYRDTSNVGSISVTTTATAFNTSSDYRLKQNVAPIADAWERVKALKPVRYEFKAEPGKAVSGFLAHELAEVCPQAVHGEKDATEDVGDLEVAEDVFEPVFETLPVDAHPLQRPNVIGHRKTGTKTERQPSVACPSSMPEGATWTKTGTREVYQGVDHSKLVADLTAALQQAMARIEALEAV